jgi:hypothetical protein
MKTTSKKELFTPDIMARLEQLSYQKTTNPIMVAKFVNPWGPGAYYVSDYTHNIGLVTMYYMAPKAEDDEWMDLMLMEVEAVGCPPIWGPLERDMSFTERPFVELKKEKRIRTCRKK